MLENILSGAWHLRLIFLCATLCFMYVFHFRRPSKGISGVQTALFLTIVLIFSFLRGEKTSEAIQATTAYGLIIWSAPLVYYYVKYHRTLVIHLIICSLTIAALWAVAQFSLQSDLNLHLLGETSISSGAPGIATMTISSGAKLVRAYGPFPHPNVLAGSLMLGLIVLAHYQKFIQRANSIPYTVIIYFILLALLLTFSRAAWLAAFILAVVAWRTPTKNVRGILVLTTLLTCLPLLLLRTPHINEVAFTERLSGLTYAQDLLKEQPIWHGGGPGNYEHMLKKHLDDTEISYQPWYIAPVHNVPLLLLVEWGIVPVLVIAAFLLYRYGAQFRHTWPYLLPLIPLLASDHYLVTQPAPLLYLILLLAVLALPEASQPPVLPGSIPANAALPATSPTRKYPQYK